MCSVGKVKLTICTQITMFVALYYTACSNIIHNIRLASIHELMDNVYLSIKPLLLH